MIPNSASCTRKCALAVVAFLGLILTTGCGDDRPKTVPVSGQVLIDGKPLTCGAIRILPQGARPATAKIGPDGRFTFKTFEDGDGVVLGTHQVIVFGTDDLGSPTAKWYAPKKYADPATSGLTVTITEQTDSLPINLTWGDAKPSGRGAAK
ncbi:MAG: hypothetical protein JW818_21025 [Pirellulales bacterium]|nr:hypothetical protein [Pirellulales bacterium]